MKNQEDIVRDYQKDLIKPTPDKVKRWFKSFDMKPIPLKSLALICQLKKMGPIELYPIKKFDPHIGEVDKYVHRVTPRSLEQLKAWVGVPSQAARRNSSCAPARKVRLHHLPVQDKFSFESLEPEQRRAVNDMAHNLLFGYADKERAAKPPLRGVVNYMLNRSTKLAVFAARDLIVCPDEMVCFANFSVIVFWNVIVYGSGRIRLGNFAKLHAYQIKRVT
jgi:hypothetical protein